MGDLFVTYIKRILNNRNVWSVLYMYSVNTLRVFLTYRCTDNGFI